jgi:hypothetical protein
VVSLVLGPMLAAFICISAPPASATATRSTASLMPSQIALSPVCLQPGSDPSTTDPSESVGCLRTMAADTSSQRVEILVALCLLLLLVSAGFVYSVMT